MGTSSSQFREELVAPTCRDNLIQLVVGLMSHGYYRAGFSISRVNGGSRALGGRVSY